MCERQYRSTATTSEQCRPQPSDRLRLREVYFTTRGHRTSWSNGGGTGLGQDTEKRIVPVGYRIMVYTRTVGICADGQRVVR